MNIEWKRFGQFLVSRRVIGRDQSSSIEFPGVRKTVDVARFGRIDRASGVQAASVPSL
jgi:hypothetical protein